MTQEVPHRMTMLRLQGYCCVLIGASLIITSLFVHLEESTGMDRILIYTSGLIALAVDDIRKRQAR